MGMRPVKSPDHIDGDPRLLRRAGAGGEEDRLRVHGLDLLEGDLVVSVHGHLAAQLAQVLDQVVGEGIVVVDHQYHAVLHPKLSL